MDIIDVTNTAAATIQNDRSKTCCFTGHRPAKIFDGAQFDSQPVRRLISVIGLHIHDLIDDGYDTFISGMARGIDMWAARLVLDFKRQNPHIRLICAMPYRGHGSGFKGADRWELFNLLEEADQTVYVSEYYFKGCMDVRNRFMVDNSSAVMGVVSDYKSGTGKTIAYAKKQGLRCDIIDLNKNAPMFLA